MSESPVSFAYPGSIPFEDIPVISVGSMREIIGSGIAGGDRVAGLFGFPEPEGKTRLLLVMAEDRTGGFSVVSAYPGDSYPAFTPDFPQLHLFERELFEDFGIHPAGHPWLKPVRYPGRRGEEKLPGGGRPGTDVRAGGAGAVSADASFETSATGSRVQTAGPGGSGAIGPGGGTFFSVHGEEIHEVAVGPVHAGIIEPGHFRFNCRGEEVLHLEIALGYQHRGITGAIVGGPDAGTIHYMETAAGDTTIGHATAYSILCEALAGTTPFPRAQSIRAIALELERIANHTGDLGALAGDVGYLPTAGFCGRLRGDILNLTALVCGNRFGRGMVFPGGVGYDLEPERLKVVEERLETACAEISEAIGLIWSTPSVLARFEGCGPVSAETAAALGLVGPAARACGLERDSRRSHPAGAYDRTSVPLVTAATGDVAARAAVRRDEIGTSREYILGQLRSLPSGEVRRGLGVLRKNMFTVGAAEGWRGEILHFAATDDTGRFSWYRIVDPSFRNWTGLAMALRKQEISDFPLCNKSFNLSYCGHDL